MVRAWLFTASCLLFGCEPKLVVGERTDAGAGGAGGSGTAGAAGGSGTAGTAGAAGAGDSAGAAGAGDAAGAAGAGDAAGAAGAQCTNDGSVPGHTDPIAVPWSTSFENGFCDFEEAGGFCFGGGLRRTVSSPAPRSGQFAAEFSVNTADSASNQVRCVRQGELPPEAYYGAWYYIPATASLDDPGNSLWNLFHFQGGDTSTEGLWDVSLVNGQNGTLKLLVYDFLNRNGIVREPDQETAIPIGAWFHIQFYLRRASDATGEVRLYQDGKLLLTVPNVVTDDSSWAQWYVGNIGKVLTPPDNTLYVDDVTIATTLN